MNTPDFTGPAGAGRSSLELNWLTLAFTGASVPLEKPFRNFYLRSTLHNVRTALVAGAIMYGAFGVLDALLLTSQRQATWLIRYALVCPAILIIFALTFLPRFQRLLQPIMTALFIGGGLGIVAMVVIIPPPISHYYYAGLILVFIFGYAFIYLRFLWASLAGWIIVAAYEITALSAGIPEPVLISNSFFLVSANIAGMLVCYILEYSSRKNFLLLHLLAEEQRKIRDINEELERRVAERTETLERINRQLTLEIQERHLAEQEQRRLEAQLKQAEKMEVVGSLASGVAHDLNNILVGLVSFPDLMLTKIPADSPLRADIMKLQDSGKRAAAMVQDLLTMARLVISERQVINLNHTVSDYLQTPEFNRLKRDHPHVNIDVRLQPDLLNIRAAAIQMSKTLMNLVANAYEAIPSQGVVTIETANRYLEAPLQGLEWIPAGEYVLLSVRDNGVGIAFENRMRIFEPFYTKKIMGRSGTGLGMTVVWHTVKEMGGHIDLQSAPGQGTLFDLYIPVTREEIGPIESVRSSDEYRGSERVLVVDDVEEQRAIASAILSKLGYRVIAAASGEEAEGIIRHQEVDIVVLDMIMGAGIEGSETFRRLKMVRPSLRAIIVSGFAETEQVREAQRLGAGAYVRKPYTMEKLARALRSELDGNKTGG